MKWIICRLSLLGNMEISFNEIAENWRNRGDIDDVRYWWLHDWTLLKNAVVWWGLEGNNGIGTVSTIKTRKYRPRPSFCFPSSTYAFLLLNVFILFAHFPLSFSLFHSLLITRRCNSPVFIMQYSLILGSNLQRCETGAGMWTATTNWTVEETATFPTDYLWWF